MADYIEAIIKVLYDETGGRKDGGYSNRKADRGGETKWGASKRAHPNVDIKNLTCKGASELFRPIYWDSIRGQNINDQELALLVLTISIMSGPGTAGRLLQRALNSCGAKLAVDGAIGPATLEAANSISSQLSNATLKVLYIGYLNDITYRYESQLENLRGWVRRIVELKQDTPKDFSDFFMAANKA